MCTLREEDDDIAPVRFSTIFSLEATWETAGSDA